MKISVIVPIYNMEKFIEGTISCLKNQKEEEIEFILINDGSTDNTSKLLKQLTARDERFNVLEIENQGYGHACNLGIGKSTGEFIAIYEPDDWITTDFYHNLGKVAKQYTQADIIRYNGIFCNENGVLRRLYHWENSFTGKILDKYTLKRFWRSHPSICNGLYRKNFILQKSISFCETPSASFQDAMFIVSLFYANPSIYIIDETKYIYTIHNLQSIKFVDDKVNFIIKNWKIQKEWINRNGFIDCDFFLYKSFMQMSSILKKVSPINRKKLEYNFMCISEQKYYIDNSIPTLKEKLKYIYFILKNFFRRSIQIKNKRS